MKKAILSLVLALCLALSATSAFALNYCMYLDNEATFETLEEARANESAFLAQATGRNYMPDPALNDYPEGTTWVYRSAKMYTPLTAAPRMNTNFLVYTDKVFASKDEALSYLKEMGLTDIVDAAHGSIVLVTPIDKEAGYGLADQAAFFKMQATQCNIGYFITDEEKNRTYYADSVYYGGLTDRYAIGVDGGATFLCDYVANTLDFVSRLAGMLLIGPNMQDVRQVASPVPAYLVNPSAATVEKFKAGNATDSWGFEGDVKYYFNRELPLQKVYVEEAAEVKLGELVPKVYDAMFIKAMRNAVNLPRLYTAGMMFSDYKWNQAPYSLAERSAFYTGKTAGGICVFEKQEDRFSDICTDAGEYIQTWYEFLPEEVVNGTAKEGSIPLILANHGGGDDTMQFMDEFGLIPIAERERVAIVAPYHAETTYINNKALPALVRYMLETYPALDASRVYTTGYSMGGMAAMAAVYGDSSLFAACVPMAFPFWRGTEEELAALKENHMPYLAVISSYDDFWYEWGVGIKANYQQYINEFMGFNDMDLIEFDFDTYPMSGFKGDSFQSVLLHNEYQNDNWLLYNADGIPMVGLNVTEGIPHGLWQVYGDIAWNYMKQFSRDPATKAILYTPAR